MAKEAKVRVLKDVLIAAGRIDHYFEGQTPVTLWRAKKKDTPNTDIFELVEKPAYRPGGLPRPADIRIERGKDGRQWVRVEYFPRGISTFDKARTFKGASWEYYRLEAGTELPIGLALVKDGYNRNYGAIHYTIAPAWDMPLDHFKRLLRTLATKLTREVA